MTVMRLTYFSRNRLDHAGNSPNARMTKLLATSVANNRRDDVTSALIYDQKWFAQVLEGEDMVVSRTFERLLQDRRHSDVRLVKMQPVTDRRFKFWWLASVAWSRDNAEIFRHYAEGDSFDPQLMPTDRLGDLINAVVNHAAELQGKSTQWTTRNVTNAA